MQDLAIGQPVRVHAIVTGECRDTDKEWVYNVEPSSIAIEPINGVVCGKVRVSNYIWSLEQRNAKPKSYQIVWLVRLGWLNQPIKVFDHDLTKLSMPITLPLMGKRVKVKQSEPLCLSSTQSAQ